MKKSSFGIGVDIGGSHISGALIDLKSGEIVIDSYQNQHVDSTLSREKLLACWADFISNLINNNSCTSLTGIGIGIPGEFDYENGIARYDQNKFTQLYEANLKIYFSQQLQLNPAVDIRFINDASAFALGEYWLGAAQGYSRVLMLTLGTGLGATFLKDGHTVISGTGIPSNGTLYDKTFADGIADAYFSTRYFVHEYERRTSKLIKGAKELSLLATQNNSIAQSIFNDFGENLAAFLKPYLDLAETEAIILGGNIALAFDHFQATLLRGLSDLSTEIKIAELGNKAGIVGAASMFRQQTAQ